MLFINIFAFLFFMSSRYRYNSQSYYNRSTGGQTNNPRVINRPYGVGYTSNQSDNVKSWAYNLMHSGYYVNDSLESMANQLTKNGYYVSQEPPQITILITKVVCNNTIDLSQSVPLSSFTYKTSTGSVSIPSSSSLLFITPNYEGSDFYLISFINTNTGTNISIYENSYYYIFSQGSYTCYFLDDENSPFLWYQDTTTADGYANRIYVSSKVVKFDLPNN